MNTQAIINLNVQLLIYKHLADNNSGSGNLASIFSAQNSLLPATPTNTNVNQQNQSNSLSNLIQFLKEVINILKPEKDIQREAENIQETSNLKNNITFDENGNRIEKSSYPDGSLKHKYKYDAMGNLIEQKYYRRGESSPYSINKHYYNASGQKTGTHKDYLDEDGNVTKEKFWNYLTGKSGGATYTHHKDGTVTQRKRGPNGETSTVNPEVIKGNEDIIRINKKAKYQKIWRTNENIDSISVSDTQLNVDPTDKDPRYVLLKQTWS